MKFKDSSIYDCNIIDFSNVLTEDGNITVVENKNLPGLNIKRIYYLYDVPAGESRGGHAHYKLEQFIIAASGSFDIILDDGRFRKRVNLNRPNLALHVQPGMWREIDEFSAGSICMVLASEKYDEGDYIRDYNEFKNLKTR